MYKNQLQELAQRSCFNLPSYTCIREGPDHAPRFKAAVNFNGETFECPSYCTTLRQAEHSAAEVALNALSGRGPSNSLAARILDETGVYKNLLQEVSQRVGACLPKYSTFRSGLGHLLVFTCTVELAGVIFTGDPAKNRKQAEKNAAMTAWFSLKSLLQKSETFHEKNHKDELEHVTVAHALQQYLVKARTAKVPFPIKFPTVSPKLASTFPSPPATLKLLPLICPRTGQQNRPTAPLSNTSTFQKYVRTKQSELETAVSNESLSMVMENLRHRLAQKFPAAEAAPYIPFRHCNPRRRIAPPVTIRTTVPVFSPPPALPSPQPSLALRPPALGIAPPISVKQAVPAYASTHVPFEKLPLVQPPSIQDDTHLFRSTMARAEQPPMFRTLSGRLEDSRVSRLPVFQVEEPRSCKLSPAAMVQYSEHTLPPSEIFTAPVEPWVSNITPANSKPACGEVLSTINAVQDKLQELKIQKK
ncbi:double-stranded RNA-binding protein 2-like isoform X2 [Andrographis paniculata]|uniref:double-stranded RNA-binding protein 2-like isoform X2 n=1 Tax=Andrographis paniculata TaxID=175694 RepID=UPI0021E89D1A|nr:double-stranded RNA-binding protein 2-like isoform X2 [Andrographis paniculata]